ncbi:GNAT family N-acetyltransferase [Fusobacterium sp. PH5-44]|uniref:GNAT family N-acetyltransferase n=1 Tax=unclassified Fusobacterium TaxID=2648384 RepID=UPI003D1A8F49
MKITNKINDHGGGFYIKNSDDIIGELTFVFAGKNKLIADHTWVDETQKGKNLGKKLFDELIEFSRANSIKVMATCPYVIHQLKKHRDELLDVIA